MKTILWIALLAGLGLFLAGLLIAGMPVAQLYSQAITDPLADTMPDDGKGVLAKMLPGIGLAAVGVVLMVGARIALLAIKIKRYAAKK
jgi:hypothetical protein